ncbi:outer membrane beta-barrel protein [Fibrella aquatilis]|uniref:outer membrane beta-barrel protein n=1 Tax=Fibrella aquatilis TaxID=2817059 RepID=UPI001E351764|nr:outer membrane beta-barrel protein [Fibrella aquatilis]
MPKPLTIILFIAQVLILLLSAYRATGQGLPRPKLRVRVVLLDSRQAPLVGASVQLTSRTDSTERVNALTDTLGVATVLLHTDQPYALRATAMGMKPLNKGIRPTATQTTFRFSMETDVQSLNTVTVTAKKPLLRQQDDMTIVDPTPIADISTNAYDLMEKTPGLFLDQDGNVYISSATPATIYINGREQKLSAADLATLLKSLPPNSIERMEIMRTPSAKYDASGSGGAVNIVLKRGVKLGRTGSISGNMNQGRFGNQGLGISLNNSEGNRSSYLNINYNRRNSYEQLTTNRQLTGNRSISQTAYTRLPGDGLFVGYGLGYELTKKWSLNLDGRANYGYSNSFSENETQIRQRDGGALLTSNQNRLGNTGTAKSLTQEVSATYKIDSLGSQWTVDGSYNYTSNQTAQGFTTQFLQPAQATLIGDGSINTNRHFVTLQTDLRYRLRGQITLETGLKTAIQQFDSRTSYTTETDGIRLPDRFRTNAFDYNEAIHAGYLQGSKQLGSVLLKVGVRAENTNMNGHQRIPRDTTFQLHRTDLFPYIYLSRRVAKIAGFELRSYLVYRRSITRPTYDFLNPFARFIDQYLYETGNPALQPQFTQNLEANVSVDEMPILAVGRNYTQNLFTSVLYQDPVNSSVAYRTYANLGQNRETYFRLLAGIPPGGRFFFVVAAQYSHTDYEGFYEGKPLNFSRGSWRLFTYQQLKLDGRSTLTVNAFCLLNGQQQFYELGTFGNVNLSLNRQFMNRKLTATLVVSDPFYTNRTAFTLNQGNILADGTRQSDTRRVGLTVRYNFGLKRREERQNPFNIDALDRGSR